ncbi:hypothetical protein LguiB_027205 [Lonicera macranthoides]
MDDTIIYNALMDGYCSVGKMDQATKVLEFMDAQAFDLMLSVIMSSKRIDEALGLFKEMSRRGLILDIVTSTTIIGGFAYVVIAAIRSLDLLSLDGLVVLCWYRDPSISIITDVTGKLDCSLSQLHLSQVKPIYPTGSDILQQCQVGIQKVLGTKLADMRSKLSNEVDVCLWTLSNGKFTLSSAWVCVDSKEVAPFNAKMWSH